LLGSVNEMKEDIFYQYTSSSARNRNGCHMRDKSDTPVSFCGGDGFEIFSVCLRSTGVSVHRPIHSCRTGSGVNRLSVIAEHAKFIAIQCSS
jgi:hypothetical protein